MKRSIKTKKVQINETNVENLNFKLPQTLELVYKTLLQTDCSPCKDGEGKLKEIPYISLNQIHSLIVVYFKNKVNFSILEQSLMEGEIRALAELVNFGTICASVSKTTTLITCPISQDYLI